MATIEIVSARARVGIERGISGGIDAALARLKVLVDDDAVAVDPQSRTFGDRHRRPHADARDHQIGGEALAAAQRHLALADRGGGLAEPKLHALRLVQAADEGAELRPEDALERVSLRGHDDDREPARAQRRRDFQADEARAEHDGAARLGGARDERAAVGERAKIEELLGAWKLQAHLLAASVTQEHDARFFSPAS